MIAALGITIVLVCQVPQYIVAEDESGTMKTFPIKQSEVRDGKLEYYLGGAPDTAFVLHVQQEMALRHQRPDVISYGAGCHSS